jgi:hypothetical protein
MFYMFFINHYQEKIKKASSDYSWQTKVASASQIISFSSENVLALKKRTIAIQNYLQSTAAQLMTKSTWALQYLTIYQERAKLLRFTLVQI